MAQQKFPFPTLVGNSVGPASGGAVTVPLQNPALAEQSQLYGDLSKRIDAVSQMGFKIAGGRAKTAGALYGARNAPTQEQLVKAQELNVAVDLPGDASSINIFQQSAYAGSLSLLEDSVEIAGRRSLTEAMAEAAANPDLDPSTFTAQLDTIVQEYSAQMATVSPTSAGKINSSLGMVANSQVVSFSREFMGRAIKQRTNEAKENVNTFIDGASRIITGHTANGDVTLLDSINADKKRIRSILEKAPNVSEDYILRQEKRFDKKIRVAQEAVVLNWVRTTEKFAKKPFDAFRELQKFGYNKPSEVPDHIKDVWKITDVQTRNKITDSLLSVASALTRADQLEVAKGKQDRQTIIDDGTNAFNKALTLPNTPWAQRANGMTAAINTLNSIGYDTTNLQERLDQGPITLLESNAKDKKRLAFARSMGKLTFKMIMDARLDENDAADYMGKLTSQRDANVKKALMGIKNDPLFRDIDLNADPNNDNTNTAQLRRRYNQAQDFVHKKRIEFEEMLGRKMQQNQEIKSTDYFNANAVAEEAVKNVRSEIINVEMKKLTEKIERAYKIIDKLSEDGVSFSRTPEGLRDALESKVSGSFANIDIDYMDKVPRYGKNADGKYSGDGLKIQNALKYDRQLFELERRLNILEGN